MGIPARPRPKIVGRIKRAFARRPSKSHPDLGFDTEIPVSPDNGPVGRMAGVYVGDGLYLRGADEPPVRNSTVRGWIAH